MQGRALSLIASLSLLAVVGCLSPERSEYAFSRTVNIDEQSDEADRLWVSVQDTLRRHRFKLDRVDRRVGLITTLPETTQHVTEFWRHDVDTWYDLWEGTLNPIRRWVEVTMDRDEAGVWGSMNIVVHKERLSVPDRQFNNAASVYRFFNDSLPEASGGKEGGPAEERWLDLGRDGAMEECLLGAIVECADLPTAEDRS